MCSIWAVGDRLSSLPIAIKNLNSIVSLVHTNPSQVSKARKSSVILAAGIYKYITTYATRIKARQGQLVSVKGSKKTSKSLLRSVRVVSFQNKSMEFETETEEKSYMATGWGNQDSQRGALNDTVRDDSEGIYQSQGQRKTNGNDGSI